MGTASSGGGKGSPRSLRPLYLRQMVWNFGNGLIGPYTSIYAVQLGASPMEMGWLRSLSNLFGNALQVPWGVLCDRLRRRAPFIILGGLFSSLTWLMMMSVRSSWDLIILLAIQSFINSLVAPAWAALIGDLVPQPRRGVATATINAAASVGSISATLIAGYIMARVTGSPSQMYSTPLALAAVCGFGSSLAMLTLRERRGEGERSIRWFSWRNLLRENPDFRRFTAISVFTNFFQSMSWPLFSITVVRIVKADMVQVAYLSVVTGVVSLITRAFVGRLADRAGRKTLIVVGRTGLVLIPVIYAFATSVYHLFAVDFVVGIISAGSEIAVFAYLLDVTSGDQRGASVAVLNTLVGVATFFGSLIGGYLASALISAGLPEAASLQVVYAISAAGRLAGGLLFLRIREPYRYPSTLKEELSEIIHEDIEKTMEKLHVIETGGGAVYRRVKREVKLIGRKLKKERGE